MGFSYWLLQLQIIKSQNFTVDPFAITYTMHSQSKHAPTLLPKHNLYF